MKRFDPPTIKESVDKIAQAAGMPEHDAAIFSDSFVEADVHGTYTRDISRLNIYIRRIQHGLIDLRAQSPPRSLR